MPQFHPGSREARSLGVIHVTTSFPLTPSSASGSFVARLVDSLPPPVDSTVLVPAATDPVAPAGNRRSRVRTFRYAPWHWQQLAHAPGGIPVALARRPLLYLLLPFFMLAMAIASARALRAARLIHAHWSVNGVVAGCVARLMGRPCVTTLWGEDVTRAGSSRLYRALLWLCLWASHHTVSVSQAMHQQMQARFPRFRDRLSFIPNGVDPALVGAPCAGGATGLHVLYVGSLIPRKSVDVLLEAWALVPAADRAGWRLTLVGAGAEEPRLRAAAQSGGFEGQVTFTGAVPPDAVARYYREADVFALPSRSEGMPSVVLEAMAAGLPIVATAIDGVRELVSPGRQGQLFAVGDAAALAGHLRELALDAAGRRRMGTAARETVVNGGFLWPAVGQRYAALYAGLVGD